LALAAAFAQTVPQRQRVKAAWREAEEIASIADSMLSPVDVSHKLAEIKDKTRYIQAQAHRAK
jgi:hypothetical protein